RRHTRFDCDWSSDVCSSDLIFSNVPFVLVAGNWINRFAEPELMWKVLALATTFAGNLTIIGSVANMIVVESAREHLEVSFWDYEIGRASCRESLGVAVVAGG